MSGDVGVRLRNDGAIETQVAMTTATRVRERCAHGRELWVVGGERWHMVGVTRAQVDRESRWNELLEPCAAVPELDPRAQRGDVSGDQDALPHASSSMAASGVAAVGTSATGGRE